MKKTKMNSRSMSLLGMRVLAVVIALNVVTYLIGGSKNLVTWMLVDGILFCFFLLLYIRAGELGEATHESERSD